MGVIMDLDQAASAPVTSIPQGERMGMKFGFLSSVMIMATLGLTSCGTSTVASAGNGLLYVTTQANSSVSVFGINLTDGDLSTNGNATATGTQASAMLLTPTGNAVFVANINPSTPPAAPNPGTISSYTVNSDGTLAAGSTTTETNSIFPMGMATDPAGKFLFVANQGSFNLTLPNTVAGSISVFSINGAALTEIPGSPFPTETPAEMASMIGTGPVSVAVAANGNYLYVANQFTNDVEALSIGSNGALTILGPATYNVGLSPSAIALTADGNFLFVANSGSNNLSAFAACTNANLTCPVPNGSLTPVKGSPFAAGLTPVAMALAIDSQGEYLFVVDNASAQVSQYKVGLTSGVLTTNSPPAISTGLGPVSVVVRTGPGTLLVDGGTTNYVYVANAGGGTISTYSYDTIQGTLTLVGTAVTTMGQPSALAVK
jgi:6-phosphogluconolactonase